MTLSRVQLGRDVHVVAEDDDLVHLEGTCRLRPGHPVVIVSASTDSQLVRTALVWSWSMVKRGSGGPVYEGTCRWV